MREIKIFSFYDVRYLIMGGEVFCDLGQVFYYRDRYMDYWDIGF